MLLKVDMSSSLTTKVYQLSSGREREQISKVGENTASSISSTVLEHNLVSRHEVNGLLWGSVYPFKVCQTRNQSQCTEQLYMPGAFKMRTERRLLERAFRHGTVVLTDRKSARLPTLKEHVQPGTRKHGMINHCQPLFWLKT